MLVIPNNLQSLMGDKLHRYSTCWQITRKDGTIFRFTDHDVKLEVLNNTFVPTGGLSASATQKSDSLRPSNKEVRGIISSPSVTTEDLREGRYRGAEILEYLVDWKYPWAGPFRTIKYLLLTTSFNGEDWTAEVTGQISLLNSRVGRVYGRRCDADLGDARCGVDLSSYRVTGATVTATPVDRRNFRGSHPTGFNGLSLKYYRMGQITWTSGNNAGLVSEIRSNTSAFLDAIDFTLMRRTVLDIELNDVFDADAGCDKRVTTCKSKFDNVENFRGFARIPGPDATIILPDR